MKTWLWHRSSQAVILHHAFCTHSTLSSRTGVIRRQCQSCCSAGKQLGSLSVISSPTGPDSEKTDVWVGSDSPKPAFWCPALKPTGCLSASLGKQNGILGEKLTYFTSEFPKMKVMEVLLQKLSLCSVANKNFLL